MTGVIITALVTSAGILLMLGALLLRDTNRAARRSMPPRHPMAKRRGW